MLTVDNSPGLAAVLAARCLDVLRAEQLVTWAQRALECGFDTPSVVRLAMEEEPFFTRVAVPLRQLK